MEKPNYDCSICGRKNYFVNECGCDPNNLPTSLSPKPQFDLKIVEDGERLYIHPLAYFEKWDDRRKNGVIYFRAQEFAPYPNKWHFLELDCNSYPWKWADNTFVKFWYVYIQRTFVAFYRSIIKHRCLSLFSWNYCTSTPIIAADVYDFNFSVENQIKISGKDEIYCEDVYINCSSRYLEKRLNERIEEMSKDKDNEYYQENISTYLTWRQKWIARGAKISFLASLDT